MTRHWCSFLLNCVASYCPEGVLVFQLLNQSGEVRVNKLNIGTDKIGPEEFLHNTCIIGKHQRSWTSLVKKPKTKMTKQKHWSGHAATAHLEKLHPWYPFMYCWRFISLIIEGKRLILCNSVVHEYETTGTTAICVYFIVGHAWLCNCNMNVTHYVRVNDLLRSTLRQMEFAFLNIYWQLHNYWDMLQLT